jgi:hypothetical protein
MTRAYPNVVLHLEVFWDGFSLWTCTVIGRLTRPAMRVWVVLLVVLLRMRARLRNRAYVPHT